jgi:hypothetical protein
MYFAFMLFVLRSTTHAQGIVYTPLQEPLNYGPVSLSYNLDLNNDGTTDYVLFCDAGGAYLTPQSVNAIIWDGTSVAAINRGELISSSPSSLNPAYAWFDAGSGPYVALGAQAIFDGQPFYGGNFSGKDAFIGLQFQIAGSTHYGWIEVNNYQDVAAGQVLGWAYETTPDMPIFAGEAPEPSISVLAAFAVVIFAWVRRYHPTLAVVS